MGLEQLRAWIPPGGTEEALVRQVIPERIPRHVAIIMDGNGRWAAQRHLPRVEGHRAGIDAVRDTVETSARLGLDVLTLYAFSVENWKRPVTEVSVLMAPAAPLPAARARDAAPATTSASAPSAGRASCPTTSTPSCCEAEAKTRHNTGMQFNIALNYGGRAEIVDAARRAIEAGVSPSSLDETRFAEFLYTAGQPDPDLLIRTSGEMRVSNFLLWQIAYAEIWVTDTLWPDFRCQHLLEAVVAYQKRDRRYGGIASVPVAAGAQVGPRQSMTRLLSGAGARRSAPSRWSGACPRRSCSSWRWSSPRWRSSSTRGWREAVGAPLPCAGLAGGHARGLRRRDPAVGCTCRRCWR